MNNPRPHHDISEVHRRGGGSSREEKIEFRLNQQWIENCGLVIILGYKMLLHSFSNDCWNINFYWTKIGFILLRNLREAPTKKLRYYLGKFYQMCEPTHPPQGFCEIWENKRWNLGRKRRFSGQFGGVLRGLDLVWESVTPPTHIWERSPKKNVFFWQPP